MQTFTDYGQNAINDLAQRYGVSNDAVTHMLYAVMNGNGTMAQFNHYELGGGGQWMQGGMTMVGDMFNYNLKSKVDGLCSALSNLLAGQQAIFMPVSNPTSFQGNRNWWPDELGIASTTGGQNNTRYAYFPATCRLAVDINGQVTVYDTLDHQIGGVSQQQGGNNSMTFSSQYGTVQVEQLPVVSVNGVAPSAPMQPAPAPFYPNNLASNPAPADNGDIFALIERLADLKQKGILSDEEFASKKGELLQRL
ncbi:SHOCT domain-containing protein [Thiothrix winogradskyi]|uniref:SHOCT domain-containing protein n=1 Tax=Thiothrix winogradskyi TaxID=96472 RepID=A0ABY3SWY6_9GAMM|nr:SHOCT domain-containing protein [Thiothrix winogradskyi]UJS22950.1 SHOCT domain-containing protein [Thiothrix winogradskyi]